MAKVAVKSSLFGTTGVGGYTAPSAAARAGEVHRAAGTISNAATDNTGSTYLLAELPWSAILLPETAFHTAGWGFAQAVIGTPEDPDGLLDAAKGASATGQTPVVIFGAKWNQPLWQQCGLAAMPTDGSLARIQAVAEADAAGAGVLNFDIRYVNHI